jgi:hypothetical protein
MKVKKFFASCLAVYLMITICSPALAVNIDNEGIIESIHQETIKSLTGEYAEKIITKTLYDLSGNMFELVETGDVGYYIFDMVSGKYIEEAPESPSPYLDLYDNLYYFGPLCYYQKDDDVFTHTVLSDDYTLTTAEIGKVQSNFSECLMRSRTFKNESILALLNQNVTSLTAVSAAVAATNDSLKEYITRSDYIKYAIYPENTNGTCGYTAACLVLNYWHQLYGGVIPSEFLDDGGNLRTNANNLQDKLLSYGTSDSSWALSIRDVLIDYCNDYGVSATSSYALLGVGVDSELENNRPVILFGSLVDVSSSTQKYINHAVTAYGIYLGADQRYIVHYGWKNYEEVLLDANIVASNTKFRLN